MVKKLLFVWRRNYLKSKQISKDEKIKALERIVKAVFGISDGTIEYRSPYDNCYEIILECDVDTSLKCLAALDISDINYWFYTGERKLDVKDAKLWNKKYEGFTEITLMLQPQYYKEVEKLKEEIKKLKESNKNTKV